MITYITGTVSYIEILATSTSVEVLTASGLGYTVLVPSTIKVVTGDKVEYFTSYQVREASQSLYGFVSREQKKLFSLFLAISGIGPKIAIAILSTYNNDELARILEQGDFKQLSKVSGLGEKGAKKIILELQGKLELGSGKDSHEDSLVKELKTALRALGFKGEDLDSYVEKGKEYIGGGVQMIEELVQKVLSAK
jgi:holliday junction DNA helicase RuvA